MAGKIQPVIMCGGAGTRVWPESRETMPKQFIALIGTRSTFQDTILRVAGPQFEAPIVITNHDYRFLVKEQLAEIGVAATIVTEPIRRDSGPAVAVAAALAARSDPASVVALFASDHVITKQDEFLATCEAAADAAEQGFIVTLGVKPTEPAIGYGYIRPGAAIAGSAACKVDAFVEKPERDDRRALCRGRLSLEFRQFLLPRRRDAGGAAGLRARDGRGGRGGDRKGAARSRLPRARRRGVRQVAEEVDRLRRDGAHQARRRGARRHRLVGRRQLGRGLEAQRARRARQFDLRRRRRDGCRQCACPLDRPADRRRRREGRHRRHHAGRGAGDGARPGRQGQAAGRAPARRASGARRPSTSGCTGPGAITSRSTRARAIRSSASSSRRASGCRCSGTTIAPSTGSSSRAPPR